MVHTKVFLPFLHILSQTVSYTIDIHTYNIMILLFRLGIIG